MCIVQHGQAKSGFIFQPTKPLVFTDVKSAKPAPTCSMLLLTSNNRQFCCLVVMVHIALQRRRVATTKKKNHLHFRRNLSANHNQAHPNLCQRGKNHSIYGIIVLTPLWFIEITKKNLFQARFIHIQSAVKQNGFVSLQRQYCVLLCLGTIFSFTLTVKYLVLEMTKNSKKFLLAAWSLMLSQRQDFLNHHRAGTPITPNQQGTMETRVALLSSVGAQDMDPSGYQVSDVEAIGFHWGDPDLKMDALDQAPVLSFFLQLLKIFRWGE